jgi:selenophosphate synthetase-related protein
MYPGMGFVLTAQERHVPELIRRFGAVGMTAKAIGTVNDSRELRIRYDNHETQVFDFHENGIMHLFYGDTSCPHA